MPDYAVPLLLQIGEEIDDFRQWEGHRRVIHIFLPDKVYLPVSPFDSKQPISDVGRKSFAVGVLDFAQEEIQMIDAGSTQPPRVRLRVEFLIQGVR